MAFRLKNNGMKIYLNFKHYPNDNEIAWCVTDFNFKFKNIINYTCKNAEIFINDEVPKLEQFLSDYLNSDLEYGSEFSCVEPSFSFRANDSIVWEVELWYDCCPGVNKFSTSLNKEQVEKLRDYLRKVIGKENS